MLFARQRQLLQLLEAMGGSAGKVDFQKLLFLFCQESSTDAASYDFVPHELGPFSFTASADGHKLAERGLLVDAEERWELTEEGRKIVAGTLDVRVASFAERHRGLRGEELVADTYRRFPFFAIRSEIAERVLAGDAPALARIAALRTKAPGPALTTIGYEGRTLESYLNALLKAGVTLLCDVRRNPLSRKYGFSKSTLARACEGVGIRYEHLPQLGIASEQRRGLDTQDDYDALFAEYETTWLPQQGEALETLSAWIRSGERAALTCYERLPQQCHRHCVAEAIEARMGRDLRAMHL